MSNIQEAPVWQGCYRCGKEELQSLRLLPGSNHITLCPACYEVVWGWHERPPKSAPEGARDIPGKGAAR